MNDNKKIIFSIIGFGKMGEIRYQTLKRISGCEVKWICETDSSIEIPADTQRTKDVNDIFEDKDVDAVIVCTPNFLLKDLVVEGLSKGKHIFCEKPPGRNLDELNDMIEAEQKYRPLKLMFGFNHRHHKSMMHAKKLIDSGDYRNILISLAHDSSV